MGHLFSLFQLNQLSLSDNLGNCERNPPPPNKNKTNKKQTLIRPIKQNRG